MRGKVKWFNEDKGFGFLTGENGKDAFVHVHALPDDADASDMTEGREVEYETDTGPKGLRATSLKLLAIALLCGLMAVLAGSAVASSQEPGAGSQEKQASQVVQISLDPAVQQPTEMIDFTAMLGSPLMIVIVTGALVQVVKKKAAEIAVLARVPIWLYAVLIAGGLTCLATYGLGTLQGAFWPLIVNIIANVLWTLGGYGLLMGLTKTPQSAAAGEMGRETKAKQQAVRDGAGWAGPIVLAAAVAAMCSGCSGMSNGQKYIIASQSYTSTANVLAVLVRAGEFTTADKKQIKTLSDQADKLLDEMRADLLANPPAAMNFSYLVIKINALLDELLRMQLAAEAAKAKAKAVSYGTDGNPARDQNGNRDAHAAVDGGGGDTADRPSADAGGDRSGDANPQNGQGEPRRGPRRDDGQPTDWLTAVAFEAAVARHDPVAAFDVVAVGNRLAAWWERPAATGRE